MTIFEYKGLDFEGRKKSGFIDADSIKAAKALLKENRKVYPTSIVESKSDPDKNSLKQHFKSSLFLKKVKDSEVVLFTRQLATLISSGFQLTVALKTIIPQVKSLYFKRSLSEIRDQVEEGSSYSKALGLFPDIFSETYVNLVHAGESSGTLSLVLLRLAESSEQQLKMERKIKAALTYPAFMAAVAAVVIVFLMTYVIPGILDIFNDLNNTPPLPTRILISTTDFLKLYWFIFPVLILIWHFSLMLLKRNEKGIFYIDTFKLKMPWSGNIIRKIATAKFCRTLSTLLENGVTLLKALSVAKNVISNSILQDAVECSQREVEQGGELGKSIAGKKAFPELATEMIKVGEESGRLEEMLNRVADIYEDEIESSLMKLTSLIEPVIILVMGTIALLIMLAVYLPIMEMNNIVK